MTFFFRALPKSIDTKGNLTTSRRSFWGMHPPPPAPFFKTVSNVRLANNHPIKPCDFTLEPLQKTYKKNIKRGRGWRQQKKSSDRQLSLRLVKWCQNSCKMIKAARTSSISQVRRRRRRDGSARTCLGKVCHLS